MTHDRSQGSAHKVARGPHRNTASIWLNAPSSALCLLGSFEAAHGQSLDMAPEVRACHVGADDSPSGGALSLCMPSAARQLAGSSS